MIFIYFPSPAAERNKAETFPSTISTQNGGNSERAYLLCISGRTEKSLKG
jgi:hypothetical protein